MRNFLAKSRELDVLLSLQLDQQIADLGVSQAHPSFILLPLDLSNLALDFVCLHVLFLLGELLLDLSQVYHLAGFSLSHWNGLLNDCLELRTLILVLVQCLSFYSFGLLLVLQKLSVPILIELLHLFPMSCLDLLPLLFKSLHEFSPPLPF